MNFNTFYEYAGEQWQHVSILEIIAVLFSILQVLLSYRNSIWLYPAGIVSCSLFVVLMAQPHVKLYAEASLNLYYLTMSIYGWYIWGHKNKIQKALPITKCSRSEWRIAFIICSFALGILYLILDKLTDSTVPFLDAFVSAMAWGGMWLLAKRKLENWILLNISNAVAIPLLFYKHLPLTALLTVFLFTVAVLGYFRWKKIMMQEQKGSLSTIIGSQHF